MRPFRAREAAAKADGLRLRRGDEPFSRWHGGAGEARHLQNPLSLFGCAEKRKRFLMVSREKTLAAAFQAPPEMPFPAFYGGYLDADLRDCVHSTAYGSFGSWGWFRMPPASVLLPHLGGYGRSVEGVVSDALCFCFAAAAVSKEWCQALSNCQGAAAKKERRSVRTGPGVSFRSRENTGGKTHGYYQSKTLVTGAASVPGEARNAAARAFFSYTIKRRILFFLGKREWGF